MIDRRALLQRAALVALGMALGPDGVAAGDDDLAVLVRQPDGRLVIVTGNELLPVREPLATPAPSPTATSSPVALPAALDAAVTEGTVGYWMGAPDGSAHIFRLDTGVASTWWWLGNGGRPARLPLQDGLEPAFPSGAGARWFHGAMIDEAHLGAGTLRLMAVEIATGEIVLDHELDRRLELAATAVTPGGEVVAHAQGVTGGVEFWVADLRPDRIYASGMAESRLTVAPSAIALHVAVERDGVIVAAELAWSPPERPHPLVVVERYIDPNTVVGASLDGDVIAIVPASSVEVDPEG